MRGGIIISTFRERRRPYLLLFHTILTLKDNIIERDKRETTTRRGEVAI